jgi:hypothetical protein
LWIIAEKNVAVLKSRSRLVTFRLDPEEYASLRRVCVTAGARSMSEFAREAVLASIHAKGVPGTSLGGDLLTLTSRLHELDRTLSNVSALLHAVLRGKEHDDPGGQSAGGAA